MVKVNDLIPLRPLPGLCFLLHTFILCTKLVFEHLILFLFFDVEQRYLRKGSEKEKEKSSLLQR